jgi:hypothetical protein
LSDAAFAAALTGIATNGDVSAANLQRQPFYKHPGKLSAGRIIDACYSRPGHLHLHGTLLLCQLLQIDESDDFVFIGGQAYGLGIGIAMGYKTTAARFGTDAPLFLRSCHNTPPFLTFVINIVLLFLTNVKNKSS